MRLRTHEHDDGTECRKAGCFRTTCAKCGGPAWGYADVENGPSPADLDPVLCLHCQWAESAAAHAEEDRVWALEAAGQVSHQEALEMLYGPAERGTER